jgi:hypothetical protein
MATRKFNRAEIERVWAFKKANPDMGYQAITTALNKTIKKAERKYPRQTIQEVLRCKIYTEWSPKEFKQSLRIEILPDGCIVSSPLLVRPPMTRTVVIRGGKAFPKRSKNELLHEAVKMKKNLENRTGKDFRQLGERLQEPKRLADRIEEQVRIHAYCKNSKRKK